MTVKQRVHKDVYKKKISFGHRVIDEWNKLLEEVVNATGINSFKSNVDKLMRNNRGINEQCSYSGLSVLSRFTRYLTSVSVLFNTMYRRVPYSQQ